MLPRFQPRCFNDLIVAISLIRPGPIMGDMVHPYLRRRLGQEEVTYFHELLEDALAETLGVILFQEQVLKVARDLAGFAPGQGELLRRALGSKDASAAMAQFREDFIAGAQANGVPVSTAELVFSKLQAFGSYSFPKSHAAAFATLVYQSAWLKHYHPLPFYVALLNNQPMGFWSPAVVLNDAKRHGIPILPVDVNHSSAQCGIEADKLRIGLTYVKGIGDETAQRIVEAREAGVFRSLQDFCQRTQLPRRKVENLIQAGAFDTWEVKRRQLLWQLGQVSWDNTLDLVFEDTPIDLPPLSHLESLEMEVGMLGLSVEEHPLSMYRAWLTQHHILGSAALERCPTSRVVCAAGLNVVHQAPPTAKGFHFITLEDEDGFINVIVRPDVYKRYRGVLRGSALLLVEGEVQREGVVTNLLARRAKAMV
jgi:error-prone DNA polymerase